MNKHSWHGKLYPIIYNLCKIHVQICEITDFTEFLKNHEFLLWRRFNMEKHLLCSTFKTITFDKTIFTWSFLHYLAVWLLTDPWEVLWKVPTSFSNDFGSNFWEEWLSVKLLFKHFHTIMEKNWWSLLKILHDLVNWSLSNKLWPKNQLIIQFTSFCTTISKVSKVARLF